MATMEYTKQGNVPITVPDPANFIEIEGEKLVAFDQPGQTVSGILLFVRACTVKGKPAVECGVRETSGNVKFFLNHDLRQKIRPDDKGRGVVVTYDHDEDTGSESKMRVYRVWLSKPMGSAGVSDRFTLPKPATAPSSDPGITDDDIPF